MKGSEIDDPGHLIGLKSRRSPNWGARQQPVKICPLCSSPKVYYARDHMIKYGGKVAFKRAR